ncbi:MAG: cysteine desulfurase [Methylococcaceae bacterium]|nr:cysteine desulfurase [Methylococcaceae bacterium]
MIYFDHNATTPIDERVVEVMLPYLRDFYGNPSSLYRMGRLVKSSLETAREQVAALVDTQAKQIIFTSGGTEANNLALTTVPACENIAVSAIEHPSVMKPVTKNKLQNNYSIIPVNSHGMILPASIEALLKQPESPTLVSIMLANNENGVIQNVKKITSLLSDKQILVHTDAIQAIGKIPVSFNDLGVDLMSLSSHKIYGPKGCGALVIEKTVDLDPLLIGGGQEKGWRSGTENVAAIVGFGKAAELASIELKQRAEHLQKLRSYLEQQLKTISGLVIFSEQTERLPNTIQFGMKGMDGEMLLMQLDQKNIAVSSGSACSSGGREASPVLLAMGVDNSLAKSAIRISLGKMNTVVEIDEFITILKTIVTKV